MTDPFIKTTEFLRVHCADNVVVATKPLQSGDVLTIEKNKGNNKKVLMLLEDIPRFHKIALCHIGKGQVVRKYGQIIGVASQKIHAGEHVHSQNLCTQIQGAGSNYHYSETAHREAAAAWQRQCSHRPDWEEDIPSYFQGYARSEQHPSRGGAGVRNEIWLVPMVQCVNKTAERIIQEFYRSFKASEPVPGIDGIFSYPHPYGCSQLGDDLSATRRILQALCQHPNAGGILLLGLGCENNTFERFSLDLGIAPLDKRHNEGRIRYLITQECGDEIAAGVEQVREIYAIAKHDQRKECPISELKIGLKCGGSDGLSGLTANPLLGRFSDYLVRQGATSVLTEVPEMFGAEKLLLDRAINQKVFKEIVLLIEGFKKYFESYGEAVFENPSPGNKAGGISTLEDKSLGCIQKGGSALIQGVHGYGERIAGSGLHLLSSPGNDGVSSSALGAAGCQIVLFSTGRGTPLGCFVPTLKISSNTELAKHKENWIDFNAGQLLHTENEAEREGILQDFIRLILATASGQQARNEDYGFRELTIFKNGITL